ncbi:MAG: Fur family transcriptional regulator [Anaerolineae bacterium]
MSDWQSVLASNGHRITAPRRAVMAVLQRVDVPLDAAAVLAYGRKHHASLGLVTVYRTLNLFQDLGLVRRVHEKDGCHGYALASPGHHHTVVCRRCGRAVEFTGCEEMRMLVRRAEAETGFQIEGHMLQLSGLCRHCIKEMRERRASR